MYFIKISNSKTRTIQERITGKGKRDPGTRASLLFSYIVHYVLQLCINDYTHIPFKILVDIRKQWGILLFFVIET